MSRAPPHLPCHSHHHHWAGPRGMLQPRHGPMSRARSPLPCRGRRPMVQAPHPQQPHQHQHQHHAPCLPTYLAPRPLSCHRRDKSTPQPLPCRRRHHDPPACRPTNPASLRLRLRQRQPPLVRRHCHHHRPCQPHDDPCQRLPHCSRACAGTSRPSDAPRRPDPHKKPPLLPLRLKTWWTPPRPFLLLLLLPPSPRPAPLLLLLLLSWRHPCRLTNPTPPKHQHFFHHHPRKRQ